MYKQTSVEDINTVKAQMAQMTDEREEQNEAFVILRLLCILLS